MEGRRGKVDDLRIGEGEEDVTGLARLLRSWLKVESLHRLFLSWILLGSAVSTSGACSVNFESACVVVLVSPSEMIKL